MENQPIVEEEKPVELTPEQKAQQEQNDKYVETLRQGVIAVVDSLYQLDIPVAFLETEADELFRNYRRMKASSSEQWDVFIKEKTASEEKFYNIKAKDLIARPYEKDVPAV